MRCWQWISFHGQRADLIQLAAVETHSFIHDHIAHDFPLQVGIIFFCQLLIGISDFSTETFDQFFFQLVKGFTALVFAAAGFGDLVNFIFGKSFYFFIQLFIGLRFLVIPFFFNAYFFAEIMLRLDLNLYRIMRYFQCTHQVILTALIGFSFHHHQIFFCCGDQEFQG